MAGGRLIATGTRNGERVEIRTPHVRMGLDRYSAGTAVDAEMNAMNITIRELIPFEELDIDSETGEMSRRSTPEIEADTGRTALDGLDIFKASE